jgi:Ca2+-binding RTX toxin-like protein
MSYGFRTTESVGRMRQSSTRSGQRLSLLIAVVSLLAAAMPPAGATVTCTKDPAQPLTYATMDAAGDSAAITRFFTELRVNNTPCGDGTRFNTAEFDVYDQTSGEDVTVQILLANGPFQPGVEDEEGSSDEIEFAMYLDYALDPANPSGGDRLLIRGSLVADNLRLGVWDGACCEPRRVVNLNGAETDGIDGDVQDVGVNTGSGYTGSSVDEWIVFGHGGKDRISATGWSGGTTPTTIFDHPLRLSGGNGRDALTGGNKADHIAGGDDNDVLNGGPGPDRLFGGPGMDTCLGGPGADVLKSCERG